MYEVIEVGKTFDVLLLILLYIFFFISIQLQKTGKISLKIRDIPALNAMDEAVGRAAEQGKNVVYIPRGSIRSGGSAAQAVAYLNILSKVSKKCAELAVPLVVVYTESEADAGPLIIEKVHEGLIAGGAPELFSPDNFRYFPMHAYSIGMMGTIIQEKPGACFLIGDYRAESISTGEAVQRVGAIGIAGSAAFGQLPFFVATCDYVLLGEELYAASAVISEDPIMIGSIGGQDWGKLIVLILIILGAITMSLGYTGIQNLVSI